MMNPILMLLLLMSSEQSQAAATDWGYLSKIAPTLQSELVEHDKKGHIVTRTLKLPSGKTRLFQVVSFLAEKRPVLEVPVKSYEELQKLCEKNLSWLPPKPQKGFSARLIIPTNPLMTNSQSTAKVDFANFENKVELGPAKIEFEDRFVPGIRNYESLIKVQVPDPSDGVVRMDLSEYNGLVCLLALHEINLRVTREVQFEKGLPDYIRWIGPQEYKDAFLYFWQQPPQDEISEAFVLGVATAKLKNEAYATPARFKRFVESIKADTQGLNNAQKAAASGKEVQLNWFMNDFYFEPRETQAKYPLTIMDSPVFIKYQE